MDHEPPETQSDENDEEISLITVDDFYDLLMEQQEQM